MIAEMLTCIALNVYYEARSEPLESQVGVANVVLNRVASDKFPDDACSVVYQGLEKGRGRCQFSWYCDGKPDTPKNEKAWRKAQDVAFLVLYDKIKLDVTEGATHYHATYVRPSWARTKKRTTRIEKHIFYRWEK